MREPTGVVIVDDRTGRIITLPDPVEVRLEIEGQERTVRLRMARGVIPRP